MALSPVRLVIAGAALLAGAAAHVTYDAVYEAWGTPVMAQVAGSPSSAWAPLTYTYRAPGGVTHRGWTFLRGASNGATIPVEFIGVIPELSRVAGLSAYRRWLAAVLSGPGLLLLLWGGRRLWALRQRQLLRRFLQQRGHRARGKVVSVLPNHVVEYVFADSDGEMHQGRTLGETPPVGAAAGAIIEVLYDPKTPRRSIWTDEA